MTKVHQPIELGLVGLGTIARAQHLPAIAQTQGMKLSAIASRNARLDDVASYTDIDALLAAEPGISAISVCTPPAGRFEQARKVLQAGRHLMLEKPPGATLCEVMALEQMALQSGLTLYTSWHARAAGAVQDARAYLRHTRIKHIEISWFEDVRKWHPGQNWIWQPGGLGVFDTGINALSILTHIVPEPVVLRAAELLVPANTATPIAATLDLETGGAPISCAFDWRKAGDDVWRIAVETDQGQLVLEKGGAELRLPDGQLRTHDDHEYANLYQRFAHFMREGRSQVDLAPLMLVADAMMAGRTVVGEPFCQ